MDQDPDRHLISRQTARAYIDAWRKGRKEDEVRGGHMDRAVLDRILAQPGCAGIRYYHARHPKGYDTIVLVGADKTGRALWDGGIAEELLPCPPHCDPDDA